VTEEEGLWDTRRYLSILINLERTRADTVEFVSSKHLITDMSIKPRVIANQILEKEKLTSPLGHLLAILQSVVVIQTV